MTAAKRLWTEGVAELAGVQPRTITVMPAHANRHRAAGRPKPEDIPAADGRDWREVPPLGYGNPRVNSPWWRPGTIRPWLATRDEAARTARRQATRWFCQRHPRHESGDGWTHRVRCSRCGAPLVKERGLWGAYRRGVLVGTSRQYSRAETLAGPGGNVRWLPDAVPDKIAS